MFRITIEEKTTVTVNGVPGTIEGDVWVRRYEQSVDVLDIPGVMAAVNRKPRKPRAKKVEA